MRELELGRDIVAALRSKAAGMGFSRIHRAHVSIRSLRQVDDEALMACLDAVTPGSVAEGARVDIERQLAAAWCLNCRSDVLVLRRADACPYCGSFRLQVKRGEDFTILTCEGS